MTAAKIPLSKGMFALVDEADYDNLTSQGRWSASLRGGPHHTHYAMRMRGNRLVTMHKYLTGYTYTDHIDGNGLNNQRSNLRRATLALNAANTRKRPGGSSRYKGVCWATKPGRWMAQLMVDGRNKNLGLFDVEEDAAKAYDHAARITWGDWGTYNFPLPGERSALTGEIVAAP